MVLKIVKKFLLARFSIILITNKICEIYTDFANRKFFYGIRIYNKAEVKEMQASMYQIEKLKEKGCYIHLEEILKINPNFNLSVTSLLYDDAYSIFGPEILAKTKIKQFILWDIFQKNDAKKLVEILNYNMNFDIKINCYTIFDDTIYNFLGADLIARAEIIDTNIYYEALEMGYGNELKGIMEYNPTYFVNCLIQKEYVLKCITKAIQFLGKKITSRIPYDYFKYLDLNLFYNYRTIKDYAEKNTELQITVITIIQKYYERYREIDNQLIDCDPRDYDYDNPKYKELIEKNKEELKNSLDKTLKILHA